MSQQSSQKQGQNRPLSGIRVLVTRPMRFPDSLVETLKSLGSEIFVHPLVTFSDAPDPARFSAVLGQIGDYSIAVFLSRQAVTAFFQQSDLAPESMPVIASIGTGTRKCLAELGYEVSFQPSESNSESMATMLIEQYRKDNFTTPILILRADRGSKVLATALKAANVPFEELAVYESQDVAAADPDVLRNLAEGKFQWLTVTSSAIARNVARLLGDDLGATKIVSISPTTTQAAIEKGLSVTAEATEYNMEGLVDAILRHEAS